MIPLLHSDINNYIMQMPFLLIVVARYAPNNFQKTTFPRFSKYEKFFVIEHYHVHNLFESFFDSGSRKVIEMSDIKISFIQKAVLFPIRKNIFSYYCQMQ